MNAILRMTDSTKEIISHLLQVGKDYKYNMEKKLDISGLTIQKKMESFMEDAFVAEERVTVNRKTRYYYYINFPNLLPLYSDLLLEYWGVKAYIKGKITFLVSMGIKDITKVSNEISAFAEDYLTSRGVKKSPLSSHIVEAVGTFHKQIAELSEEEVSYLNRVVECAKLSSTLKRLKLLVLTAATLQGIKQGTEGMKSVILDKLDGVKTRLNTEYDVIQDTMEAEVEMLDLEGCPYPSLRSTYPNLLTLLDVEQILTKLATKTKEKIEQGYRETFIDVTVDDRSDLLLLLEASLPQVASWLWEFVDISRTQIAIRPTHQP